MSTNGNAVQTRSHIIKSAAAIISEGGFSALTAANLIKRAEVSKGGLYHHFKQMGDVAYAALEYTVDQFLSLIDDKTDATVDLMLERIHINLSGLIIGHQNIVKGLCCFYQQAAFEPVYQEVLQNFSKRLSDIRLLQLDSTDAVLGCAERKACLDVLSALFFGGLIGCFTEEAPRKSLDQTWGAVKWIVGAAAHNRVAETAVTRVISPQVAVV